MSQNRALSGLMLPVPAPRGVSGMGYGGLMLPEEHFPSHSSGVAPPSFFLLILC